MAIDLNGVFTGIGVGRVENGNQSFIQKFAVFVRDVGETNGGVADVTESFFAFGEYEGFADGNGIFAGNANDGNAALAAGGGDGGDGRAEHGIHKSVSFRYHD